MIAKDAFAQANLLPLSPSLKSGLLRLRRLRLAAPSALPAPDDDVYYYIRWRLKLEGETENMGVCTKERKGVTAAVLMATPCTN